MSHSWYSALLPRSTELTINDLSFIDPHARQHPTPRNTLTTEATMAAVRADYNAKTAELKADLEATRGEREQLETDLACLKVCIYYCCSSVLTKKYFGWYILLYSVQVKNQQNPGKKKKQEQENGRKISKSIRVPCACVHTSAGRVAAPTNTANPYKLQTATRPLARNENTQK